MSAEKCPTWRPAVAGRHVDRGGRRQLKAAALAGLERGWSGNESVHRDRSRRADGVTARGARAHAPASTVIAATATSVRVMGAKNNRGELDPALFAVTLRPCPRRLRRPRPPAATR